jgi:DNA/RNA endonuclease G (NUC1)
MAGHPLANSARYDRGHLMANSTGGGCDINLVPQLAKVNRVQFRILERKVLELARDQMQSFYFVRCLYRNSTQLPVGFEQGIIQPNGKLLYATYSNL